jgi:hypothetical protein
MKRFLLTTAAFALLALPAMAADLPAYPVYKAPTGGLITGTVVDGILVGVPAYGPGYCYRIPGAYGGYGPRCYMPLPVSGLRWGWGTFGN